MNSVFYAEAREFYALARHKMQNCILHAVGGKHACDICVAGSMTGQSPCLARSLAVLIEDLYAENGGDPADLTARIRKTTTVKVD